MIGVGVSFEFVARFVNERRQRPDEDGTQQETGVGQEPRRRHDSTVAETDGDRRSGEAVSGENGLSTVIRNYGDVLRRRNLLAEACRFLSLARSTCRSRRVNVHLNGLAARW
jgi:hypothetical protein